MQSNPVRDAVAKAIHAAIEAKPPAGDNRLNAQWEDLLPAADAALAALRGAGALTFSYTLAELILQCDSTALLPAELAAVEEWLEVPSVERRV